MAVSDQAEDKHGRAERAFGYALEDQVGHLLRRAHQRATAIFLAKIGESQLTPTQFAALAKLYDADRLSQNHLGRLTAMDPATIQGVIKRLADRGLIRRESDPIDRRRTYLGLTDAGRRLVESLFPTGFAISDATLEPLAPREREAFLKMLRKLG